MNSTKWWVECGANLPNGRFVRNVIVEDNQINKFRFKYDNKGVFATAYKYDSPQQKEALLIGDFYLDLDSESIDKVLVDCKVAIQYINHNFGIDPSYLNIYFSGKKGIHIIIPGEIFNISPSKDLNRVFRMMAEDIKASTKNDTIDLKIYDSKRLFRLPNSIHPSTGLYKVPLTYEEVGTLSEKDIYDIAKTPRIVIGSKAQPIPKAQLMFQGYMKRLLIKAKPAPKTPLKPLSFTPPCIEALLNNKVGSGQRNNSAAALASFFRQQGMDKEESMSRMEQWNNEMCDPPINDMELSATLDSVYKGEYKMGCTWLHTVSTCDHANCKLYKKRRY